MASDFDGVVRKAAHLERELAYKGRVRMLHALGRAAKSDYDDAIIDVTGSDQTVRNWRRPQKGKSVRFAARYEIFSDHEVGVFPRRPSIGPFKVLDVGRKAGEARKTGRAVSKSSGRNIAPQARTTINRNTPKRVRVLVAQSIQRGWKL